MHVAIMGENGHSYTVLVENPNDGDVEEDLWEIILKEDYRNSYNTQFNSLRTVVSVYCLMMAL
jgi:hypothetical protein